jgi:methylmalonyl-CoA mutase
MADDVFELAAEFAAANEDEWLSLVGRPIDGLTTTTIEGIAIRPLYDGPAPRGVPVVPRAAWDVRALHYDPDAARANAAALTDLENGATSLWLVLGTGGLAVDDLGAALQGVYLDLAPVVLDAGAETMAAARVLLDGAPSGLAGSLGADPIGWRARTGGAAELGTLGELAAAARPHPMLRVATVDASIYHDAGASDADELAIATAVGVAYLRALTDAGVPVEAALARLEFRFAVTANQFLSIAKLRAARQMWAQVAALCGVAAHVQYQHAVTSRAMLTRRDPWVNMLRTTIGCFAAAVGGADAITVLPFDAALGLPDDFARRIARNTSAILHDESSLARVSDAAGGSGYVETLTAQLAQTAWDEFTALERAGGALAALDSGRIPELIARSRDARADDIAHRRFPITGVSEYALPDEAPLPRQAAPAAPSGGPLTPVRYAEEFEALRDRAEAADPRPAVFLAALGPFAAHSARVGFATNLFNAGGLRVMVGTVDDFADSGAQVACLCASDEVYAEEGAGAAAALRAAGARQVWLAGRARVDGVDGQLFAGCDALAVLRTTLESAA